MKNLTKMAIALVATGLISCALFTSQASAAMITGELDMNGNVTLNTSSLTTATAVNTWNAATTSSFPSGTGAFSGIAFGTPVTFHAPWTFGLTVGGPTPALWTVGGFTFDLTADTVSTRTANLLDIRGSGTLSGNGYTPTPGLWEFTINNVSGNPQTNFSFTASTAAPDGGSAVALLGIAMAGIGGLRRFIRSRKA